LSSADLVIKNGRVAVSSSLPNCAVAAKDGRVTWIGQNSNAPRATRVVDASGLLVLPGVIDVHVHLRDPGATYKEDFRSGTAAAAAGGVTTVFDMPNNTPPTDDAAALGEKVKAAGDKALVDYALYGLLAEGSAAKIPGLLAAGVIGFKWYMAETPGIVEPPSDDELSRDLPALAKARTRLAVHAEDNTLLQERLSELRGAHRVDPRAHYESRPGVVEGAAVEKAITLAREAKCNLHIAHLSSALGARRVKSAKLSRGGGGRLTAETCPQYLLLDEGDYAEKRSLMKVNPSIKGREDRLALWRAVRDGTVDMISSDHAPHTLEEKTSGASIFDLASGFPGLETSVALMLTCVSRGLLSLTRYVQLASAGPARAWRLFPKKGTIALGADADFTIVDTRAEWKIDPSKFLSKAKYSPFEGFEVRGAAVYTVVRGVVVMDRGHVDVRSRGEMQRPLATARRAAGRRSG
jgi:dihydroorotase